MENAIAPHAFNYRDILANLKMTSTLARRSGVPVFYSVQTPFDLLGEAPVWVCVRMKRAKVADPNQLLADKDDPREREIVDELAPQAKIAFFRSDGQMVLSATDFGLTLRSNGVRTILIGGVATEDGVEGTARSARNFGYDVVILADCVGSRSRELHEMALKLREQTHFDLATAGEIAAAWK